MDTADVAFVYWPTTAVFVDDSERYLTKIALELDTHLPYMSFSQPKEVLSYLTKHGQSKKFAQLEDILPEIYNPHRFNEPSVLVVDYAMPGTGMDGFQLCAQVKQHSLKLNINLPKIILLSGQADEKVATEGISKGYIDIYISKKEPKHARKVHEAIQDLQKTFFYEKTKALLQQLSEKPNFYLGDAVFVTLFQELYKQHNIVESFMVSYAGDFLFLQFDGTPLWLIVIPETEFAESDRGVHASSFKKISGERTNYYYALVSKPDLVPIQREKILAFNYYLDYIWPVGA